MASLRKSERRIAALESIIHDTLWMARRYAHGRQSYAVGMYNDAVRRAITLGVQLDQLDGSLFAIDAMDDGAGRPAYSGLSQEEFDEAVAGLNKIGVTPHPNRFSPAARAALQTGQER